MLEFALLFSFLVPFGAMSLWAVQLGQDMPETLAWRISGRLNRIGQWILLVGGGLVLSMAVLRYPLIGIGWLTEDQALDVVLIGALVMLLSMCPLTAAFL